MPAEFTRESCFGDDVIKHEPPLIYDIYKDPGELFPLNSTKYSDILAKVNNMVQAHISSIALVASQIGNYNADLQPCCNPPNCVCNYPDSVPKLNVSIFCLLWTLICSSFIHYSY